MTRCNLSTTMQSHTQLTFLLYPRWTSPLFSRFVPTSNRWGRRLLEAFGWKTPRADVWRLCRESWLSASVCLSLRGRRLGDTVRKCLASLFFRFQPTLKLLRTGRANNSLQTTFPSCSANMTGSLCQNTEDPSTSRRNGAHGTHTRTGSHFSVLATFDAI